MSGWGQSWFTYGSPGYLYTYVNTTDGAQYYGTYVSPRNTRFLLIQLWGGGGGGASADNAYPDVGGGGGGGGGYTSCVIRYKPDVPIQFNVGYGVPPNGGSGISGSGTSVSLSPIGSGFTYPVISVNGGTGGSSPAVGAGGGAGGTVYNPVPSVGQFLGVPNATINVTGGAGGFGGFDAGGRGGSTYPSLGAPYPAISGNIGYGSPGGYPGLAPYRSGGGAIMLYFY